MRGPKLLQGYCGENSLLKARLAKQKTIGVTDSVAEGSSVHLTAVHT